MPDIDLKAATPDTTLPTTGFLFGADSQAAASPSVFTVQSVATTLLGSTTLTGATVTTSSPVIDAAQTWNAGGVTFTGLKFNATDTASAAASLLMDLQVGGASKFRVSKSGTITTGPGGTGSNLAIRITGPTENTGWFNLGSGQIWQSSNGSVVNRWNGSQLEIVSSGSIAFSTGAVSSGLDTILTRRAAANLRLGAADAASPVAQTLSVQSVVAGTTNTAGANLTITGSQGTGTGAGGSIIFQVAPAGSSGTAQNALADALTITSGRVATFFAGSTMPFSVDVSNAIVGFGRTSINYFRATASGGSLAFGVSTSGAVNQLQITNNNIVLFSTASGLLTFNGTSSSFPALKRSTTSLQARLADDSAFTNIQGKLTTETAYTAGAPTATGYLVLYDSNGTAYKVPAEAL